MGGQDEGGPLSSIPPLSRTLAGAVLGVALLRLLAPATAQHYLALVPGYTVGHMYVWNLVTCSFYELSLFAAGMSVVSIMLFGRYLEPLWGPEEFLRFTLVVNALSAVATFVAAVFLYSLFQTEALLFSGFGGFAGALAGYAVAMKQLHPDSELLALYLPLRAKHLPALLLALECATALFFGFAQPFTFFGVLFSWTYLRFFQKRGATVGDHSAEFAFSTLLPEQMQGLVTPLESAVWKVLVLFRCCPKDPSPLAGQPSDLEEGNPVFGAQVTLAKASTFDSERRRALAMQAIDERMAQREQPEAGSAQHDRTRPQPLAPAHEDS